MTKALSAFASLPPHSECPLLQPGCAHSSHSWLAGFIHLILQWAPPPLFSSPSAPFTLIFHHSLQLPIPLFRGPTRTLCYGGADFAQLLLLSKKMWPVKRAAVFNMPCPIPGHGTWGRTERWDIKMRFPAALTPLSLISHLLPFYLLPCCQSPCPHLFLFTFLSVPWERTEKTRRSLCLLIYHLQERDCWFTPRAFQSVHSNYPALHTLLKVLWKKVRILGVTQKEGPSKGSLGGIWQQQ